MTAVHAVIRLPVDSLRAHPRNYRDHPEDQLAHITRSIEQHGLYRNIVVARDGTILAGHGVVDAARRLGIPEVAVIRLDVDPDEPKAIQVLTGDNEIANLGDIHDRQLVELLRELADHDLELLIGTGFDEQQLNAYDFVSSPPRDLAPDDDSLGEWVGLPGFEPTAQPRITIKFVDLADRDQFIREVLGSEHHINKRMSDDRVWSTWWPAKKNDDVSAVRFEDGVSA
jgi:hypothetical protein